MVNDVTLIGRVGIDVTIRTVSTTDVATFTLATSSSYKKGDEWVEQTEWHNVEAWGSLAKTAGKWAKKGAMLYVKGSLKYSEYESKDGTKRSVTRINADRIRVLARVPDSDSKPQNPPESTEIDDFPF